MLIRDDQTDFLSGNWTDSVDFTQKRDGLMKMKPHGTMLLISISALSTLLIIINGFCVRVCVVHCMKEL